MNLLVYKVSNTIYQEILGHFTLLYADKIYGDAEYHYHNPYHKVLLRLLSNSLILQ